VLGDVMLGRMVGQALAQQEPAMVWSAGLRELASSLDLVVCNLECCISTRGTATTLIEGKPFFFRAPPGAVDALSAVNVGVVGLANNHALDFGEAALQDTLELLARAGIASAGAGFGVDAARAPAAVHAGDLRVGLVAASDDPAEYAARPGRWGIAHATMRGGVAAWLVEKISAASERCDLVIAFPHWGPNMSPGPAGWQQRAAAELHAAGADLVAGHSAHVFHGVGWASGPTLFDLGDALDDYRVDPELRNDLGVLAIWRPRGEPRLELVGLRLDYCHTSVADGDDADWIAARLERSCRELGTTVNRPVPHAFTIGPIRD
jgi:poly-gamma-glutamate synthesis protein (capsule biosynthesis protein)